MSKQLLCVLNTQRRLARLCWNYSCFPGFSPALRTLPCTSRPYENILNEHFPTKTTLAVKKRKTWPCVLSPHGSIRRYPSTQSSPSAPSCSAHLPRSPSCPPELLHLHCVSHTSLLLLCTYRYPVPLCHFVILTALRKIQPMAFYPPPSRLQLSPSTPPPRTFCTLPGYDQLYVQERKKKKSSIPQLLDQSKVCRKCGNNP